MKHPHYERLRRAARLYHRNRRGDHFEQGMLVRHDYSGIDPNSLSWWDDVTFILGKVRVAVCWRHPRCAYQDLVQDAAHKAVEHLYPSDDGWPFGNGEKQYKKVGRSRKKVSSYVMSSCAGSCEWFDALRKEEARLGSEATFTVKPSIRVEMLKWSRYVEIVAPLEIRNEAELRQLTDLVRRILKGTTTLEQEFPGYVYDRARWHGDGLAEHAGLLISHRIAGT